MANTSAKPFLKWAGSKRALVGDLMTALPSVLGTYHEPFVGGGALFFALAPQRAVLYDANPLLMQTYIGVKDHVENVIRALRAYAALHSSDEYYRVRSLNVQHLGPAGIAAWFIYLNHTCFNGLWRVNKKGLFNVPIGDYANPPICDAEGLRDASRALQSAHVVEADFRNVSHQASKGDVVYFDPPYVPLSKTANFTAYTKSGFGPKDQQDLFELALLLKRRGVRVILSNAGSDEVVWLYGSDFTIHEVRARRSINSKASARGPVKEYIITG
jgi:DNA adenine methylase